MRLELFFVRQNVSVGASLWQLIISSGTQVPDDEKINKAAKANFGEGSGINRKLDDNRIVIAVPEEFCKKKEFNFLSALAA